jgi:hypothetical protein
MTKLNANHVRLLTLYGNFLVEIINDGNLFHMIIQVLLIDK